MTKTGNKMKTMKITGMILTFVMLVTILGAFSLVANANSSGVTVTIDTGKSVTLKDADDDGYYEIGTADELYAYATVINSGQSFFNVELTADIVVNPGTFDKNGNYTAKDGESVREWTPIGTISKPYNSTLDGRNYTISGLFTKADSTSYVGLFGYVGVGTVENVGIIDSYFLGNEYVGSIAGFNGGSIINCFNSKGVSNGYVGGKNYVGGLVGVNEKIIVNCFNANNVSGTGYIGGVVGQNQSGSLDVCNNFGTVNGTTYVGGVTGANYGTFKYCCNIGTIKGSGNFVSSVTGTNKGTVQNCYYKSDSETDELDGTTFKTAKQFKSGEVCNLLGHRYLNENCVCTVCYAADHDYENGFCTNCDAHEPAVLVTDENYTELGLTADYVGYYAIGNAGQLYWFAWLENTPGSDRQELHGDAGWVSVKDNAVLTADIVVNENVLATVNDSNFDPATTTLRKWDPISLPNDNTYLGTFDGNGYTIRGLYFNNSTAYYVGLFGCLANVKTENIYMYGAVKNLGILDSYFNGGYYVGGVAGISYGSVQNCYNAGNVSGVEYVGGLVGKNGGAVMDCYNAGNVSGNNYVGGIVGENSYGAVENCYYLSDSETDTLDGTSAKTVVQFASGEVAYLLNLNDVEDALVWGQTIGTDAYPVFKTESNAVYYGYISCAENAVKVYTNDKNASAEKLGHSGGTATCITSAVCGDCGASYGNIDENAHSWNGGVVTTNPTCSTVGTKTYTCTHNSEHTKTEDVAIDENAHAWNEGIVTTNPTCSAVGVKTFTCAHNSEHTKTEEVNALGHAYDNACDSECNTCGEERIPAEHVDDDGNNTCDICGAEISKDGLSGGAIVGIVIGSVAVLGGGGFALWWFAFRKKRTI